MNQKLIHWWKQLTPYKGIIYFLILLFFFHFSWKLAIDGDRDSQFMYLFGKEATPQWFFTACRWLTLVVGWFVRLFPNTQDLVVTDYWLYFPDGGISISIIWGCTGIKQLFIFCGIMIFYRCLLFQKFQWNKLWYIPLGCLILSIYNIVRIGFIVMLTNGHPDRFESLHDGIFRYIYYTIVFILWVVWEEVYVKKALKVHGTRVHGARK
jgi:exosortase/archaeosortase family protein